MDNIIFYSILFFLIYLICVTIKYLKNTLNGENATQLKIKAEYISLKKNNNLPCTYLPYSKFKFATKKSIHDAKILYHAILEESESGDSKYTTSEVSTGMRSYSLMIHTYSFYMKSPMFFTILLIAMIPFFWAPMILIFSTLFYHSRNVSSMERIFNDYLNKNLKKDNILSITAELERLNILRDKGTINETEYVELKRKIING